VQGNKLVTLLIHESVVRLNDAAFRYKSSHIERQFIWWHYSDLKS